MKRVRVRFTHCDWTIDRLHVGLFHKDFLYLQCRNKPLDLHRCAET
jgi:hypothetical protein